MVAVALNVRLCPTPQEMLASGYIQECHKFSKFIQGSASLYPDMVQVGII